MTNYPLTELGRTAWHCGVEYSGPDIGLSLGLGDGRQLYVGEISNQTYETAVEQAHQTGQIGGGSGGWWLVLYGKGGDTEVIGKCVDSHAARVLIDTLEIVARKAAAQERDDNA